MNTALFEKYGIQLSAQQKEKFADFLHHFCIYNSHTNLSAIRDEDGIIEKHFIDSLMLWKHIDLHGSLLDIGSGGGFPGIPLKIMLPELEVTLLDSVGKKTRAQQYFIQELGLAGIESVNGRAEMVAKLPPTTSKKYRETTRSEGVEGEINRHTFDFVVSRATAYITDILPWSLPFIKPDGKILLMKMLSEEEQKDMQKMIKKLGLRLENTYEYELAGQKREIIILGR